MRLHTENISKYGRVCLAVLLCCCVIFFRLGFRVEVFRARGSGFGFGGWASGITCDTSDGSLSHCRKMDSTTFSAAHARARYSQGLRWHAMRPRMGRLGKMDAAPLSLPRVCGLAATQGSGWRE